MNREPLASFRELLAGGERLLEENGVPEAKNDAWLLFSYVFDMGKSSYFLHMDDRAEAADVQKYKTLLARRAQRIPLQYVTGEAWFCGNRFAVDPRVLIPRQDTEVLAEEALRRLQTWMRVLDLCTGSGCLLLSLLKEIPADGTGSDISKDALEVAEQNRRSLSIPAVNWVASDLFEKVSGRFDMIVSNPPYIASDVIGSLDPEVRDHEPHIALDGHADGMYYITKIIKNAGARLNDGGWLLLEIGYDQGIQTKRLLEEAGFTDTEIIKDLAGFDRVAAGRRKDRAEYV